MSILPPMYDAHAISEEIDEIVLLQQIAVDALNGIKLDQSDPNGLKTKELLQKQFAGSFILLGSTFEFGVRQILDFYAVNMLFDNEELTRGSLASLKTLKKTLERLGLLTPFFSAPEWDEIMLLVEVRNKIVHVLGWHDDIEFEPMAVMKLNRYGLVMARGYHPMGSVGKFLLAEETCGRIADLYKHAIQKVHEELRDRIREGGALDESAAAGVAH